MEWILEAKGKSDLLAVSLQSKCVLIEAVTNQYTDVESKTHRAMKEPAVVTEKMAEKELCALDVNSATGPDKVPARILKECAQVLAKPVSELANIIMREERWPASWIEHWIVPFYKTGSFYLPLNYRGVHLTA